MYVLVGGFGFKQFIGLMLTDKNGIKVKETIA